MTKVGENTQAPRTTFIFPVGFAWPQCNGVTVIDAAAHSIELFPGEGVNLAARDAMRSHLDGNKLWVVV